MSLLGNYSVLNKSVSRKFGGTEATVKSNFDRNGTYRNMFQHFSKYYGLNDGYLSPYNFVLPQKSGGLATRKSMRSTLSLSSANLAGDINISSNLSASMNISNADLALIVNMLANLSASMNISNANLTGVINASANLSASSSLNSPTLGAIVNMSANLNASINSNCNISGIAHMSANILPYTELSPQALANYVWNYDIASVDTATTAGKKLNDLSGGGASLDDIKDAVWNTLLEDHNVSGSTAEKLKQLLTKAQFIGLK